MGNEPFWSLVDNKHADIENRLFKFINTTNGRQRIRDVLLGEYFSPETANIILEIIESNGAAWDYSIETDLLVNNPFEAYKKSDGKRILTEKEIQKRDRGFSLAVRRHYKYHCAICKAKILTPGGASLTEGAHIIPWSESYNDDPRNGLSLCRNHHWMFDRLLITVNKDLRIEVSPILMNHENQVIGLNQIKGESILLPDDKKYEPAAEAILDHNDRFTKYHEDI